jgi:hypothetical protein
MDKKNTKKSLGYIHTLPEPPHKKRVYPFVSIVVLNFNGKQFLEKCLSSILSSDYPSFEAILVDNGSTDGSVKLVKDLFGCDSRLKIVRSNKNLGIAEGFNIGARAARGEYIAFQQNDVEPRPDWLEELVTVMERDPMIGAAQGKILSMLDRRTIDCAGGFLDSLGFTYRRGHNEEDRGYYNEICECFLVHSLAMVFRKEALDKVGLFPPDFFLDKFDTDLSLRLWIAGYRVVYVPTSITYHRDWRARTYHQKPAVSSEEWTFHSTKTIITLLLRNYEISNVIKLLPSYICILAGYAAYSALKAGNPKYLQYLFINSVLWNLSNLKQIFSERLTIQKMRRRSDKEIMKRFLNESFRVLELVAGVVRNSE